MEALADKAAPRFRQMKGFKRVTFFADEQEGVYGSLALWEPSRMPKLLRRSPGQRPGRNWPGWTCGGSRRSGWSRST
jgi:hypothetical protein